MDQRLPALGRRPWFALRRRARCFRRAFFAISVTRVAPVAVVTQGWSSPPLEVAASRWRRWRGWRGRKGDGLILEGGAVHGRGLAQPIRAIGVDAAGRVVGTTVLTPGRFVAWRHARFTIEVPLAAGGPADGSLLVLTPIVRACREH